MGETNFSLVLCDDARGKLSGWGSLGIACEMGPWMRNGALDQETWLAMGRVSKVAKMMG